MEDEDIKSLSNTQVLTGIEDIVREKFGWVHGYITNEDGAITGMIVGIESVIDKFKPQERKGMLQ